MYTTELLNVESSKVEIVNVWNILLYKLIADASGKVLRLKELTNFTKVGVFRKTCGACHYCLSFLPFPPFCVQGNPSLPRSRSLGHGILGSV